MSVTVSYSGDIKEFKKAVEQANEIMRSKDFFTLIASRGIPFKECSPKDLSPAVVADVFRKSKLSLTLEKYTTDSDTGGRFRTWQPKIVWLNTNARHRGSCRLSCVLIHECVHALSKNNKKYDFSHDDDGRKKNLNTAPYWIQNKLTQKHCPGVEENDVILVEVSDKSEDE